MRGTISAPVAGIGLMLAAMALFSAVGACAKALLAQGLPLPMFMLSRAVITMAALSPFLLRRGGAGQLAHRHPQKHHGRGVSGMI